MGETVRLQRVDQDALDYVEKLLSTADLPTADIHTPQATFYVATLDGERIGAGGIEQYGSNALLRSLVVESGVRGGGLGTALCDELEATAGEHGVETVYLLTTTAASFFRRRGYDRIERAATPGEIRRTTEFEELCPSSAVCLRKFLDREG